MIFIFNLLNYFQRIKFYKICIYIKKVLSHIIMYNFPIANFALIQITAVFFNAGFYLLFTNYYFKNKNKIYFKKVKQ